MLTPGGEPRIRRLPVLTTPGHWHMTPRLGTDGLRIVYPIRGIAQAIEKVAHSPQRRTVAYVIFVVCAASLTATILIGAGYGFEAPVVVVALAGVAAVAERSSVRLTRTTELSISVLPALVAAVLFGPLEAAVVGAASMLGDPELTSRRSERAPRLKWAAYTSTRFITGALTGLAAQATILLVPSEFGGLIAATLVGALVGEGLEIVFAAITAAVRGGSMREAPGRWHLYSCSHHRSTHLSSRCWRTCISRSRPGRSSSSWFPRSRRSDSTTSTRRSVVWRRISRRRTRRLSGRTFSSQPL